MVYTDRSMYLETNGLNYRHVVHRQADVSEKNKQYRSEKLDTLYTDRPMYLKNNQYRSERLQTRCTQTGRCI